jgi:hypothetical protein
VPSGCYFGQIVNLSYDDWVMSSSARAKSRSHHLERLLATARSNPAFAQRLVQNMPEQLQLPFAAEVLKSSAALEPKKATRPRRPSVKKCKLPGAETNGLSAQLHAFARLVGGSR